MKRIKYCLDTSVLNFIFADDSPEKKQATLDFFKNVQHGGLEIYISDVVVDEIGSAPDPIKIELQKLLKEYSPVNLEMDLGARELAEKYIAEGIIPERYRNDALHIAVAVVNNMDALVSWNFKHIVKMKTKQEVNGVNKMLGYREIELITPEEAF